MSLRDGFFGGSLIGSAAAVLLLGNGDVLGASGIVSTTALHPVTALTEVTSYWKLVFLTSFSLTTAGILKCCDKQEVDQTAEGRELTTAAYMLAGALVGLGTKLGNGCTSGHGVCGLARISRRSVAAVVTFLTTGIVTSTLTCPNTCCLWIKPYTAFLRSHASTRTIERDTKGSWIPLIAVAASVLAPAYFHRRGRRTPATPISSSPKQTSTIQKMSHAKAIPAAVAGALFAAGLKKSQMLVPARVFGFLDVSQLWDPKKQWDPTLMAVLVSAVLVSFVSYQWVPSFRVVSSVGKPLDKPLVEGCTFDGLPGRQGAVDRTLITGAALFGIGWGLAGLCPGPALFHAVAGYEPVLHYWWPSFLIGSWTGQKLKETKWIQ